MTFDRKEYNKIRAREYYKKNKEVIAQKRKEYNEKNKEYIAQRRKKYDEKNKEAIAQKRKEHYQKNKENLKQKRKEYREKNKEALNLHSHKQYYKKKENFQLRIGNKSTVKELDCYYCGYNYEDWEKKEQGRRARGDITIPTNFIDSFESEHIHSFFIVNKTFDKESMKNHPIYMNRINASSLGLIALLPDEYIREYLAISCKDCNYIRIKQDRFDIKNYQDRLNLEKKQ